MPTLITGTVERGDANVMYLRPAVSAVGYVLQDWALFNRMCRFTKDIRPMPLTLGPFGDVLLAERREPPGFPTVIPDGWRRAATK